MIGRLRTNEGKPAVDELITALKKQKPVQQLKWNDNLMKAARDWAQTQGPSGGTGHVSADGKSTPSSRVKKYMKWERTMGENIMYGGSNPLGTLSAFLIDDGVASRGHRTNIFKSAFAQTGAYTGKWGSSSWETVVVYSGSNTALNFVGPKISVPAKFGESTKYPAPDAKAGTWDFAATASTDSDGKGAAEKEEEKKEEKPASKIAHNNWACQYWALRTAQIKYGEDVLAADKKRLATFEALKATNTEMVA
jgi:hypothetical protein